MSRDKVTNNVVGWDSLFSIIEKENQLQDAKLEQAKKLQKDFVERNKTCKLPLLSLLTQMGST